MSAATPAARATVAKAAAAVAVVAVLAVGASQFTKGGSSSAATPGAGAQSAQPDRFGNGAPPRMGAAVTGATLTKLEAAATAKYPGTVERAMKLPDGSYVVHLIRSSGKGEVHVLVGKDFTVTGVQQGGPPPAASGSSAQS